MKPTFLNAEKAILTVMVQAEHPDRIKELMKKAIPEGAEAFGMQFEKLPKEYRTPEVYKELFSCAQGKPVYVTNYLKWKNEGKTYDDLATELLEIAECGATLCDVMGDFFDKREDELAVDKIAIEKQEKLIDELHSRGAEVLMSSHILKYTPAERVLEIALEHQRRGADVSKIVTSAETMEEQLENLKIINMLKEKLNIPFLFLASGECNLVRKIGGELGCAMYLVVCEEDEFVTPGQPLLKNVKAIRDNI